MHVNNWEKKPTTNKGCSGWHFIYGIFTRLAHSEIFTPRNRDGAVDVVTQTQIRERTREQGPDRAGTVRAPGYSVNHHGEACGEAAAHDMCTRKHTFPKSMGAGRDEEKQIPPCGLLDFFPIKGTMVCNAKTKTSEAPLKAFPL